MKRREFLGTVSIAGAAAAGCNLENEKTSAVIAHKSRKPYDPIKKEELYKRLEKEIDNIQAFNNHLHTSSEINSLNWYFTGKVIGASNAKFKALTKVLNKLLDIPSSDSIEDKKTEEVYQLYKSFCETHSTRDYYHKLADLTNTSHIAFISDYYWSVDKKKIFSERLKSVPNVSHWVFPLDNSIIKKRHPRHDARISQCERRLNNDEKALGAKPASFQGYLDFVSKTVEMYRKTPNVIGLKWNFAYWRTLNIQLVTKKEAKRIYESQNNNPEAYKKLQDYLVYHVLKRCTELEFPLQIHTGLGADPGLILYESNAGLLDLIFSRPELENARVECLHGSYPYCKELSVIARRKNVWLDFSWMVLLLEPHDLARYLKEWIQITGVNKIIFGVDASGLAQVAGTWCARKALSIALTDLVQQDFYSEQQAISAARAILQKNAINFYKPTLT